MHAPKACLPLFLVGEKPHVTQGCSIAFSNTHSHAEVIAQKATRKILNETKVFFVFLDSSPIAHIAMLFIL